MKLRRVKSIDILRIVCCISVYTQHFFGMTIDEPKAFVNWYRSSVLYKTILCSFSSEIVLMAFFVTGGFFIPAALTDKDDNESLLFKMLEKSLNILIPGLAIVLITAGITAAMKPFGLSDIFDLKELFKDIFKLVIGIPGDVHIHFGYPLWFQHFMFIGYIAGFLFLIVFGRYDKVKFIAYAAVMAYTLFNSPFIFLVFCGMFGGELCYGRYSEKVHEKLKGASLCLILMITVLCLMPLVFDFDYSNAKICGPVGLLFIVLMAAMYNFEVYLNKRRDGETDGRRNRLYSFLSANTYSCYLVHFAVYCSALRVLYRISLKFGFLWRNKAVGSIVLYILITPVLWIASAIFTKLVIAPLKKSYVTMINDIKKRTNNA